MAHTYHTITLMHVCDEWTCHFSLPPLCMYVLVHIYSTLQWSNRHRVYGSHHPPSFRSEGWIYGSMRQRPPPLGRVTHHSPRWKRELSVLAICTGRKRSIAGDNAPLQVDLLCPFPSEPRWLIHENGFSVLKTLPNLPSYRTLMNCESPFKSR